MELFGEKRLEWKAPVPSTAKLSIWPLVILKFYYVMMHTVMYNVQFVVLFFILLWDSAKYFANKQNRLMLCAEALAYEF